MKRQELTKGQKFKVIAERRTSTEGSGSHYHKIGDIVTFTGDISASSGRPQMLGPNCHHYTNWEDFEPLETSITIELYPSLKT